MVTRSPRSRFFDAFFREFPLGLTVQPLHGDPLPSPEKIRIDVRESGILVLTLPKQSPGTAKRIAVE